MTTAYGWMSKQGVFAEIRERIFSTNQAICNASAFSIKLKIGQHGWGIFPKPLLLSHGKACDKYVRCIEILLRHKDM